MGARTGGGEPTSSQAQTGRNSTAQRRNRVTERHITQNCPVRKDEPNGMPPARRPRSGPASSAGRKAREEPPQPLDTLVTPDLDRQLPIQHQPPGAALGKQHMRRLLAQRRQQRRAQVLGERLAGGGEASAV